MNLWWVIYVQNIKFIHLIEFELQGRVDTVLYTDKSVDKGSHRKSWAGDMDMIKYLHYLPSSFHVSNRGYDDGEYLSNIPNLEISPENEIKYLI